MLTGKLEWHQAAPVDQNRPVRSTRGTFRGRPRGQSFRGSGRPATNNPFTFALGPGAQGLKRSNDHFDQSGAGAGGIRAPFSSGFGEPTVSWYDQTLAQSQNNSQPPYGGTPTKQLRPMLPMPGSLALGNSGSFLGHLNVPPPTQNQNPNQLLNPHQIPNQLPAIQSHQQQHQLQHHQQQQQQQQLNQNAAQFGAGFAGFGDGSNWN